MAFIFTWNNFVVMADSFISYHPASDREYLCYSLSPSILPWLMDKLSYLKFWRRTTHLKPASSCQRPINSIWSSFCCSAWVFLPTARCLQEIPKLLHTFNKAPLIYFNSKTAQCVEVVVRAREMYIK